MNRDWFARTQPETDAKLELLRQYPGVMHVDAHEMGGNHYFFPPAADPIYHEVTPESVEFTDGIFGAAIQAEFDRQHIQYFNDKVFDFFALVYGDIVPSVAFGSGGDDVREGELPPDRDADVRALRRPLGRDLGGGAEPRADPARLARLVGRRLAQGAAGQLQPNVVNDKGNTVQLPVPDIRVRHYFLRADDPDKARRGAVARPAAAADGRRGVPADGAAVGAGLHAVRPARRRRPCCRPGPTGCRCSRRRSTGSRRS